MTPADATGPAILTVGTDSALLQTRQLVLQHAGYEATTAHIIDSEHELSHGKFELLVLCSMLTEDERNKILGYAPRSLPSLSLHGLTSPEELLGLVSQRLKRSAVSA
jgi:hypothetical protein